MSVNVCPEPTVTVPYAVHGGRYGSTFIVLAQPANTAQM